MKTQTKKTATKITNEIRIDIVLSEARLIDIVNDVYALQIHRKVKRVKALCEFAGTIDFIRDGIGQGELSLCPTDIAVLALKKSCDGKIGSKPTLGQSNYIGAKWNAKRRELTVTYSA